MDYCCKNFEKAHCLRTDSQGCGSEIYRNASGGWSIGYGLAPIKYCPWCGKEVH